MRPLLAYGHMHVFLSRRDFETILRAAETGQLGRSVEPGTLVVKNCALARSSETTNGKARLTP